MENFKWFEKWYSKHVIEHYKEELFVKIENDIVDHSWKLLIDFSNTKNSLSVRIVDYLSGMLMALEGDYRKLAPKKFLISRNKELSDKFEAEFNNI